MNRLAQLAALAATTAVLLTGCGSGSDRPASSTQASSPSASPSSGSPSAAPSPAANSTASPEAAAVVIMIKDYEYQVPSTVGPGDKVMVTNQDTVAHTVTADQGSAFDVSVAAGKTAVLTAPDRAGSFAFHCKYHSNMEAKLTVG